MSALQALKTKLADINALEAAGAVLDWDQQTYMPPKAVEARARHASVLGRLAHEMWTSDELQTLLGRAEAEAEPGSVDAALVRIVRRETSLKTKIPAQLVERKAQLAALGHEVWVEARAASDFGKFAPTLAEMVDIVREEANCLGVGDSIYDPLLDQYEEGSTAADVRTMFETIKQPTVDLVRAIRETNTQPDTGRLIGEWDQGRASEFTLKVVQAIGFDLQRGRQDVAPHPFCTNFSVNDVRLTTRFKPYIGSAIFGSLHEAGHGMYEQGSPEEWDGTPLAGGVSLGVHESQSRLWENIVGRSRAFWEHFLPSLQGSFPELDHYNLDSFYAAVNKVEPSLIRVEADELTYNLHILLRFEIELGMLEGTLAIKDLPEAWNEKMREYLGIVPPNDAQGCLQDVHWSGGSIGYFPTYSMGNLLSYQIWARLQQDIPNTDELMAKGHFAPIFDWLRERIYAQGSRYTPKDLVVRVTGKPMGADDWMSGMKSKYSALYRLA